MSCTFYPIVYPIPSSNSCEQEHTRTYTVRIQTSTLSKIKDLFYFRDVFHADECLRPLLCFLGRLRFPLFIGLLLLVGADTDGQSFAAILLRSSQSQAEAIADPCRPSKAAPTHLTLKMCKTEIVLLWAPQVTRGVTGLHGWTSQ